MARRCVKCDEALPAVRTPTSMRQMMWGGWTCTACGAEMNARLQLIDGTAITTSEEARITLRAPNLARDRSLVLAGAFGAPVGGFIGLIALSLVGMEMLMLPLFAVMAMLMIVGVLGVWRVTRTYEVVVSAATVVHGDRTLRIQDIDAVRRDGPVVVIAYPGGELRLEPEGGTDTLIEALDTARRIDRDLGDPDDIPQNLSGMLDVEGPHA